MIFAPLVLKIIEELGALTTISVDECLVKNYQFDAELINSNKDISQSSQTSRTSKSKNKTNIDNDLKSLKQTKN